MNIEFAKIYEYLKEDRILILKKVLSSVKQAELRNKWRSDYARLISTTLFYNPEVIGKQGEVLKYKKAPVLKVRTGAYFSDYESGRAGDDW